MWFSTKSIGKLRSGILPWDSYDFSERLSWYLNIIHYSSIMLLQKNSSHRGVHRMSSNKFAHVTTCWSIYACNVSNSNIHYKQHFSERVPWHSRLGSQKLELSHGVLTSKINVNFLNVAESKCSLPRIKRENLYFERIVYYFWYITTIYTVFLVCN